MNILVILMSAVAVLSTTFRTSHLSMGIFSLGAVPCYFLSIIRRDRASGRGDMALGELFRQVRKGRRLRVDPLELAAAVAMMILVLKLMAASLP